jgi:hypothetical protein
MKTAMKQAGSKSRSQCLGGGGGAKTVLALCLATTLIGIVKIYWCITGFFNYAKSKLKYANTENANIDLRIQLSCLKTNIQRMWRERDTTLRFEKLMIVEYYF